MMSEVQIPGDLCSRRSQSRGRHQKVLSFSFWGNMDTGYWRGIVENLDLMELHYPDWVLRLYVRKVLIIFNMDL